MSVPSYGGGLTSTVYEINPITLRTALATLGGLACALCGRGETRCKERRRALANMRPPCRTRRGIAIAIANDSTHPPRDTTDAAGSHRSLTGAPLPPKPPRLPTVGACALCVPLRGRLRPRRYRLRNVALPLSRLVCLAGRSSGQARRAYTSVSGCSGMAGSCALISVVAANTAGSPCFRCAHSPCCRAVGGLLKPRSAVPPSAFLVIPTPLHFGSSPVAPAPPPIVVSARGYAPSGLICRLARAYCPRYARGLGMRLARR